MLAESVFPCAAEGWVWNRSEPGQSFCWSLQLFRDRSLSLALVFKRRNMDAERRKWLPKLRSPTDVHFCSICFTEDETPILASSVPQDFAGWYRQEARPAALHSAGPNSNSYSAGQSWVQTVSRARLLLLLNSAAVTAQVTASSLH